MGLPIHALVCATNENDVLDEFFRTGRYRVRSAAQTVHTSSPSMDISKASNFERFVFDLFDGDSRRVRALWSDLARRGEFDISATREFAGLRERFGLVSASSDHALRMRTIAAIAKQSGVVIDTHTADGVSAAHRYRVAGQPMIVLETALAAKFSEAVEEALGQPAPRPERFSGIESLPQHFTVLPASIDAVRAFMVGKLEARAGG
jgi:threonine synthase